MCGRFSLVTNAEKLLYQFPGLATWPAAVTRYNIAPTQSIWMLCQTPDHGLELISCAWGLIPFWETDIKTARPLFNARSETLSDKPVFKEAYQKRRGLVIMSGFFEWQTVDGKKQPWYITRDDDRLLTVAAIWESRADDYGNRVISCSLVTTAANELMQPIHDRMPVLVADKDRDLWLDSQVFDKAALAELERPKTVAHLIRYPVTPKMNNARFDSPAAILPLAP